MAKTDIKIRKPSRLWIGKTLTARQDVQLPVFAGAPGESVAEILDGQKLRVIGVRSDGWLECKLLGDVGFRAGDRARYHTKDLVVGVNVKWDIDKFRTLRQESLNELQVAGQPLSVVLLSLEDYEQFLAARDSGLRYKVRRVPETGYRKVELRFADVDSYRAALEVIELLGLKTESTGESVMEGILELLDEIPDGYAGSAFSQADRDRIREVVASGAMPDSHPSWDVMIAELERAPDAENINIAAELTRPGRRPCADPADIAALWVAHVLAPFAIKLTEQVDPEQPLVEPQPGVARDVVEVARKWLVTKRKLSELKTQLARLSALTKDLESKLLPIVRELDGQVARIDNTVLALQSRDSLLHKDALEKALQRLEGVADRLLKKATAYLDEVTSHSEWLRLEQSELVQAFTWLSGFARRAWMWLRKTGNEVTELERLVFYGE